jgi:geranylgeranyl pyrophosphate synthase
MFKVMRDRYAEELDAVHQLIERELVTGLPDIDKIAATVFSGSGKQIRSILTFLTSDYVDLRRERAIPLAAAIELIHAASLIHDDVLDNADIRRGNVALHKIWGNKKSILYGDYLWAAASRIISQSDPHILTAVISAASEMIEGALLETATLPDEFLQAPDMYIAMIHKKTGSLMAAALQVPALAARIDHDRADILYSVGRILGVLFQLSDDCIDYTSTKEVAKKDVNKDLLEGFATYPLIAAYQEAPEKERRICIDFFSNVESVSISDILSFVRRYGGIAKTKEKMSWYMDEIHKILPGLGDDSFAESILGLSRYYMEREY